MIKHSQSLETVFGHAIEIESADERTVYLDRACGDDASMREAVQQLVDDHFRAGEFLSTPLAQSVATVDVPAAHKGPGTKIGPYKLADQIGEGGFSTVFLAEQAAPVRRSVALKILKPGMDSREVLARFEAERHVLGLLDHPHIAKVLDAGTTESGAPYFVMELVRGVHITQYCDEARLTYRQRLELFADVCRAVQHAHQKGIIHRDLKPSNVMVTLRDDRPVVKVIDFGIAKALGQLVNDTTALTVCGQMIGVLAGRVRMPATGC